jgi:serine/threonine-protein kinase
VQVSNNGGMQPAWAANGRELFYTEAGNGGIERMMAVDVTIGDTFRAGRPRQMFEADFGVTIPNRSYDVTRDATRFIVILRDDAKPAAPITEIVLVQNWFEELKRLAPARQ